MDGGARAAVGGPTGGVLFHVWVSSRLWPLHLGQRGSINRRRLPHAGLAAALGYLGAGLHDLGAGRRAGGSVMRGGVGLQRGGRR
jgi:hypothetical protein